jgi:hypothetical protein
MTLKEAEGGSLFNRMMHALATQRMRGAAACSAA